MVHIHEEHEECRACMGTGQQPCNGTDTGWCPCPFCGGSTIYVRRLSPRDPWGVDGAAERDKLYERAIIDRWVWESVRKAREGAQNGGRSV